MTPCESMARRRNTFTSAGMPSGDGANAREWETTREATPRSRRASRTHGNSNCSVTDDGGRNPVTPMAAHHPAIPLKCRPGAGFPHASTGRLRDAEMRLSTGQIFEHATGERGIDSSANGTECAGHERPPARSMSEISRSSALRAGPRVGGPLVSQRWTVLWSTPKRSPKAAWLSPTCSLARRINAPSMSELCVSHSERQRLSRSLPMQIAFMTQMHERLAEARRQAGYESATAAAEALGLRPPTYMGHENGSRGLRREAAELYAREKRTAPSP